ARRKELQTLWAELQEFSRRHAEEVEFYLWGFDPAEFGELHCPTFSRPFDYSYERYLTAIREEQFDYVVCPLFPDHDVKISKSPIKYLEAVAAGAVGIFSDSPVYRRVIEDGLNGYLTADDRWLEALERAFATADEERMAMFAAAKAHALARFTTESQVLEYLSAFEAARLHAELRSHAAEGGKARVAYFIHESALGGATLHIMRHAAIARQYGFEPVLVFPAGPVAEEAQRFARQRGLAFTGLPFRVTTHRREPDAGDEARAGQIGDWLKRENIRLVHAVTYLADVALAAYRLRVPYVNTLHQHYPAPSAAKGTRLVSVVHSSSLRYAQAWQQELGAPAYTLRAPVESSYFEQYLERQERAVGRPPTFLLSGTLQPRKGHLAAIRAIGRLRQAGIAARLLLVGYDIFVPQYVEECRKAIRGLRLEDAVTITGFTERPGEYFEQADFMLCASEEESMPQTILQAMAAGMVVVSTPVGGVSELVLDGFSGIMAAGSEEEAIAEAMRRAIELSGEQRAAMVRSAHQTARMVCSEEVVSYQLLKLYNAAVRENQRVHGSNHPPYEQG
ncbi:glycosyltransferase, partial [Ornatilinea apprima]|uniref:glycosyltransferase n=1 Tax=Ornatilinea apprima TaxID=1134406 RepID=UPI00128F5329